jgi:hypothetical protein
LVAKVDGCTRDVQEGGRGCASDLRKDLSIVRFEHIWDYDHREVFLDPDRKEADRQRPRTKERSDTARLVFCSFRLVSPAFYNDARSVIVVHYSVILPPLLKGRKGCFFVFGRSSHCVFGSL